MRVLLSKKEALEAASVASGACGSARSANPTLRCFLIEAGREETFLVSTNGEIFFRSRLESDPHCRPGRAIVPAETLLKILRFSDSDTVSLDYEKSAEKLLVGSGSAKYSLFTEDSSHFPDFPDITGVGSVVIEPNDFDRLVSRTVIATQEDSPKYAIHGCLVSADKGSISFVATDGRRLSREVADFTSRGTPKIPKNPVIPARSLKFAKKAFAGISEPVAIGFYNEGRAAFLRAGNLTVATPLCHGSFPPWEAIVPQSVAHGPVCEIANLLRGLGQASVACDFASNSVSLEFEGSILKVTGSSSNGTATAMVPLVKGIEEPVRVVIDPAYANDWLKTIDQHEGRVTIGLNSKESPIVFTHNTSMYVLMPMGDYQEPEPIQPHAHF